MNCSVIYGNVQVIDNYEIIARSTVYKTSGDLSQSMMKSIIQSLTPFSVPTFSGIYSTVILYRTKVSAVIYDKIILNLYWSTNFIQLLMQTG